MSLAFQDYRTKKAQSILGAKNIAPLLEQIHALPSLACEYKSHNGIHILSPESALESSQILKNPSFQERLYTLAKALKPWRKGPFHLFDLFIDSEWQSFIKWQLLEPHLHLRDKKIADIGCNNGYYMFEMFAHKPRSITGFDPSGIFRTQFELINHFLKLPIDFELLGIEDLGEYVQNLGEGFDVIFCLGVLYHRYDPISMLKILSQCLNKGGELILDTLIYESDEELCLCPAQSYAKMSNVYFIPSIATLRGWCERAKLSHFELLALKPTTTQEQRSTEWVDSQSLGAFLNPSQTRTIEGYQAPVRGYFKLKKS